MKKKIGDINNWAIAAVLLLGFVIVVFGTYTSKQKMAEIEQSGTPLIAKFSHIKEFPKTVNHYFYFFYGQERINCDIISAPEGFSRNVGRFYRIKYLEKYPERIVVQFDEEVTDRNVILKSGFQEEDLMAH
ncbi:MAG TPA: hypothetical protein VGB50_11815 [Flavobacterium sp.]